MDQKVYLLASVVFWERFIRSYKIYCGWKKVDPHLPKKILWCPKNVTSSILLNLIIPTTLSSQYPHSHDTDDGNEFQSWQVLKPAFKYRLAGFPGWCASCYTVPPGWELTPKILCVYFSSKCWPPFRKAWACLGNIWKSSKCILSLFSSIHKLRAEINLAPYGIMAT